MKTDVEWSIKSIVQVYLHGKWVTKKEALLGDPRDYELFAIIADVHRDDKHKKYNVIAPRRGVPYDMKTTFRRKQIEEMLGKRNHSWLSFMEIDDYVKLHHEQRKKQRDRTIENLHRLLTRQSRIIVEELREELEKMQQDVYYPDVEGCDTFVKVVGELENIQKQNGVQPWQVRYVFGFMNE